MKFRNMVRYVLAPFLLSIACSATAWLNLALAAEPSAIYNVARLSLGKEMWKGYGLSNGKLGCAAALSNILKKAGVPKVSSPLVTALRKQLLATTIVGPDGQAQQFGEIIIRNGEASQISDSKLLKECQPGDILLAFLSPPNNLNGGTSAHCGIMGQCSSANFPVYTNNYMDGIWTEVDIHQMFDCYPYVRLLRLQGK